MGQINAAEFEALWEGVKERPLVRAAQAPPAQPTVSLTAILNRYMTMAANHREWGKISQQDYNELSAAVTALKTVLGRINDSALVADAIAQNAAAMQQKASGPKI